MAMRSEQSSKFAALNRQWWRLHISEKFSRGTKTSHMGQKQSPGLVFTVSALICIIINFDNFNLIQKIVARYSNIAPTLT